MAGTSMLVRGVICAALFALVTHTSAHVYMQSPAPRQLLDPQENGLSSHDGRDKPGSICGDGGRSPSNQFGQRMRFPTPPQNYLKAGQRLEISTRILAGHLGRFSYYICHYKGGETSATVNQECFNKYPLRPVEGQQNVIYSHNYYWLGSLREGEATMSYYLPSDIDCDGKTSFCVLQMSYEAGHTCNPPGFCPANDITKCGTHFGPCGSESEWYRNCADVIISGGKGGGAGSPPAKISTPPPKKNSTPPPKKISTPPPKVGTPPSPKTAPRGDACCVGKSDGLHANPANCRLVCSCSKGKTVKNLACRKDYLFDARRKKCRSQRVYKC